MPIKGDMDMFRKFALLIASGTIALSGVACSNSSSTTAPSVAPTTTMPSTAPTQSTLSQSQVISLSSAIVGTDADLRSMATHLDAGATDSAKADATKISTTMSSLRSSLNVYQQANWDTTGQLFHELSSWRKSSANLSLEVIKATDTTQYASWSKQATKLAKQGDSINSQVLVASGMSPAPMTPTP
jgi:hypothetical protein